MHNTGTEIHTFLTYIIENYHSLPAYVGFSQGSLDGASWVRKKWGRNIFRDMLREASANACSSPVSFDPNIGDGDWSYRFGASNAQRPGKKAYIMDVRQTTKLSLRDWLSDVINITLPSRLSVYPGSFMVIRKDRIMSRPISYYEHLMNQVSYTKFPLEGHYMERSWYYVFKCGATQSSS